MSVATAFGDKTQNKISHTRKLISRLSFIDFARVMISGRQVMSNQEAVDVIKSVKNPQAAANHFIEVVISKKAKTTFRF
ncbi:hypothetical protein HID58_012830 [Brassica napus]|uniref:Uncharacterized protein n=1 Tax=Brassica napus TaxID=3708 RepID=A0ABQ8E257_BRANA|nr:hypothetical protein HID58_012830 [Brassica napus]